MTKTIFQSSFRFTTKPKERYKDFFYTLCPHTYIVSLSISLIWKMVHFFLPRMNVHWHITIAPQKSMALLKVYSWWCTFCVFAHHIQSIFTPLKNPVFCLLISTTHSTSGSHWSFYYLHSFAFLQNVGFIQHIAFSGWLLSLSNIQGSNKMLWVKPNMFLRTIINNWYYQ